MRRNGFTLIELIAVLVILGVIGLIAVPAVSNTLKSYKNSLYEDELKNLVQSAKNWAAENIGKLPNSTDPSIPAQEYPNIDTESSYSTLKIKIKDLQEEGYIGNTIKNPKKNTNFCNCAAITITNTNQGYIYEIDEENEEVLLTDEAGCTVYCN